VLVSEERVNFGGGTDAPQDAVGVSLTVRELLQVKQAHGGLLNPSLDRTLPMSTSSDGM
jgi:hypothetical protein